MSSKKQSDTKGKDALRMWLRLLNCESMVEQLLRARLRVHYSITLPQFDVLAKLDYMKSPLTMSELSNHLMVSNGNITGVVDRLVRDGLVERLAAPDDRRVQLISLSKKGGKEFRLMAEAHENWVREIFEGIGTTNMQELTELLSEAGEQMKMTIENLKQ
ncbi:MAG: MarR family transcriptional regulator [Gammaproteobacteria bacterium]|nr:MarR family transcriptional regulator [Gammaproteobacteria bacterium]